MNFASLLDVHARSRPSDIALYDTSEGRDYTWGGLQAEVNGLGNSLVELGVRREDRVGILMYNSSDFLLAFLAAMKLGAVPVPLNVRWSRTDIEFVLEDSGATLVFCGPGLVSTATFLLERGIVNCVISADESERDVLPVAGAFLQRDLIVAGGDIFDACPRQNSDIADITYTSGSTGSPKGVIHHHGYHFANFLSLAEHCRLGNQDVGLALSPLFHQSGQMVWSIAHGLGGPLVVTPRWDVERFLASIESYQVSYMHLITTVLIDVVNNPETVTSAYDTSSVKVTLSGGGTASAEQLEQYEERVGGVLCGGYGRTEGGFCWETPVKDVRRLGRNGRPLGNNADVRIVRTETRDDVGTGETGDILMRGDGVSPGYWSRPELNSQVFDADGWMRTGDVGYWDEEGHLYFEGRRDQMIKTGGENVYPADVENTLLQMPEIAEVAVVGVPDERLSERIVALVVARDSSLTADLVKQWGRRNMTGFKRPRTVVMIKHLHRLGSQKLDYAWAKQVAAEHVGSEDS